MNVRLLRKVAKHISEEPRRLNMNVVACNSDEAPCGTVGCIAGWTCILKGMTIDDADFTHATELLNLTAEQRDRLFAEPHYAITDPRVYGGNVWPKLFAERYVNAKSPRGRKNATVARIEHFIKTKGKA